MQAKDFYLRFKELFKKGSPELQVAQKNWKNPREFTNSFINEYIPKIITEKDEKSEFEYFRIDIISYLQRKDEAKEYGYNSRKLKPYLWDLKVAFEHENNKTEWLDEIIKLSHIRCPLRIVMCYFERGEERTKALGFAADMLCKKIGENVGEGEEFLLVIGDSNKESEQGKAPIYTPYLYKNAKFETQDW